MMGYVAHIGKEETRKFSQEPHGKTSHGGLK
jgi:hypothetical protein